MTKQSMKRIHSITIKRMVDDSPDTSWLGEYSNKATSEYSIDRAHSEDCSILESNHREPVELLERAIAHLGNVKDGLVNVNETDAWKEQAQIEFENLDDAQNILIEAQDDLQQCDCGRGEWHRNEYRYFNPSSNYQGETPENTIKYVRQDYERMESLNRGDWCFVGIRADATYSTGNQYAPIQSITSGGVWGFESDMGEKEFESEEENALSELREQLKAIGFSSRAITAAFKNVERKEE